MFESEMDRGGCGPTQAAGKNEARTMGASSGAGESVKSDIVSRTRHAMDCCASEGLRSRAGRKAQSAAVDAARYDRLAEKLTPEIENMLWCLQEALALGLIDARAILESLQRAERERAEPARHGY